MTKHILITGATSGIGRHAALWLARRGHHIIASGRRQHALDELLVEAKGLQLDVLRLDVTDSDSIQSAAHEVNRLTNGHGLDVLINNAGYGQGGAVLDIDIDAVRRQYETNVFGLLEVTRAFSAKMIHNGSGRIINISSIGGRITFPLLGVYNSTKYAVESLSDALRAELAPLGVQVVIVQPGTIRTRFGSTVNSGLSDDGGRWSELHADSGALIETFERFAPDPTPVSHALARAVESRWPRARYVAPLRDSLAVSLLTSLPTFVLDTMLSRLFGLNKVRRPTPTLVSEAA